MRPVSTKIWCCTLLMAAVFSVPRIAIAQFSSGSSGADGPLNFPADQGTVLFEPQTLGVDTDGDNIYHFTTITVGANTTVVLRADTAGLEEGIAPVWLATGAVTIDGTISLEGERGHASSDLPRPAIPGAGGFAGGQAGTFSGGSARGGSGPGGGSAGTDLHGGHAGHITLGNNPGGNRAVAGVAYGNAFLFPMVGGSGGGGGSNQGTTTGRGGGAGGGAIVIATSDNIALSGTVNARGGNNGSGSAYDGGEGSGGSVRLMANNITGSGTVNVSSSGGLGAAGRARLEGFTVSNISVSPASSGSVVSPSLIFPPADSPTIRVATIGGVAVAQDPLGGFVMPDATINASAPVVLSLAATNIPVGTQVEIRMVPETGTTMTFMSNPLAGSLAASTADTAAITIPSGFTRFFLNASWTP